MRHLRKVSKLFDRVGIAIKPTKAFLGHPTVVQLGQRVNQLDLAIAEDISKAINQQIPNTLNELGTHLGMTGYLRLYGRYYAPISPSFCVY